MNHIMKLREIYFNKIKDGEKIYEIRLNDEKRKLISIGDTLTFLKEPNHTETLETIVEELIHYNSFEEMTNSLDPYEIGFDNEEKQSIIDIYHSFYSTEEENKYGVLAIKVKVNYTDKIKFDLNNYINSNFQDDIPPFFKNKNLCNKPTKNNIKIKKLTNNPNKQNTNKSIPSRVKMSISFDSISLDDSSSKDSLSVFDSEESLESSLDFMPTLDSLTDIQIEKSFSKTLLQMIDSKNMSDSECYKRANIDRKLFSKIRCNDSYQPTKKTVFAFAIALKLNISETKQLLESAGYSLSRSFIQDIIVEYFIIHKQYNIFLINEALSEYGQQILGSV
ncbi:MAG: ASCH domain-containing protein [Clostridia bacterium]|nr:ASCH domain-containing protein [Clostridia bacterium]